ncbi:hypothetical protein KPP_11861 [Klebsiella phage KPP-1]|nr:hypothetical protein KPP_11861 [Klebsiella phage KPP-1]
MNYSDFGVTCAEDLEQDEWSLTRPTFETPKGGVLKVVGLIWVSSKGRNRQRYILSCSTCSMDPELHGDGVFYSEKRSLQLGYLPCYCSKNPRYTEQGVKTLSLRLCKDSEHPFEGLQGEFLGQNTLVKRGCALHGSFTQEFKFLKKGYKCPSCKGLNISRSKFQKDEDHISDFYNTGMFKEGTIFGRSLGKKDMWSYRCPVCSEDEFVSSGLCSGIFTSSRDNLKAGKMPCRCVTKKYKKTEDVAFVVKNILKKKGLSFRLVATGDFNGAKTPVTLECKLHGFFETQIQQIKKAKHGCPKCADSHTSGFLRFKQSQVEDRCRANALKHHLDFISVSKDTKSWVDAVVMQRCSIHGVFTTKYSSVRQGAGCPRCGVRNTNKGVIKFIQEAKTVHGETYDYSLVDYKTARKKVKIICKTHGVFEQLAESHIRGRGCKMCAGQIQTQAYVNIVFDSDSAVALKIGIAKDYRVRIKQQNLKSIFHCENLGVWEFSSVHICRLAEEECKQTLKTGVLSAREMKDGWTETVSVLDLEKVIAIYEKHGGKRIK